MISQQIEDANDISIIQQCLSHRISSDKEKQIVHYLNVLVNKVLSPTWYSLLTRQYIDQLVQTFQYYGIRSIQALLNNIINEEEDKSTTSQIHKNNILYMLAQCCHSFQHLMDEDETTIRLLISIPDKLITQQQQQELTPKVYYSNLTRAVMDEYFVHHRYIVLPRYINIMVKRGNVEYILPQLLQQSSSDLLLKLFQQLVMDAIVLHKLILAIITVNKTQQQTQIYIEVFSELLVSSEESTSQIICHIFTDRLLLSSSNTAGFSSFLANQQIQLNALLFIVKVLREASVLQDFMNESFVAVAFRNLVSIWKESSFIKQTTEVQQNFVTYVILLLLNELDKVQFDRMNIIPQLLQGIQNRLASTSRNIQRHASMVAQKCSSLLNPNGNNVVVLFESLKDELSKFENLISEMESQSVQPEEDTLTAATTTTTTAETKSKKKKEHVDDDPDALAFVEDDTSSEEEEEEEGDESDSDSDTSSLEALSMSDDDEEDLKKVKPPKYLSDLHMYLTANENDVDRIEKLQVALQSAADLITRIGTLKNTTELNDRCIGLLTALSSLRENYSIPNFELMILKAKKAIVTYATEKSVKFLTRRYDSDNVNMADRIDILIVLADAALELSNRQLDLSSDNSVDDELDNLSETSNDNEYKPKYPEKTRRWTRQRKQQDENTKPNSFLPFARLFAYPFLKDPYLVLMSEDAYVLSRRIRSLGVFVYCCGSSLVGQELAKEVADFAWACRFRASINPASDSTPRKVQIRLLEHHQLEDNEDRAENESRSTTAVRQSVLTALLQCFLALTSSDSILEKFEYVIDDILQWLIHSSEYDPDNECRELAHSCLSVLRTILKQ
jgi:hypothetical protein